MLRMIPYLAFVLAQTGNRAAKFCGAWRPRGLKARRTAAIKGICGFPILLHYKPP